MHIRVETERDTHIRVETEWRDTVETEWRDMRIRVDAISAPRIYMEVFYMVQTVFVWLCLFCLVWF